MSRSSRTRLSLLALLVFSVSPRASIAARNPAKALRHCRDAITRSAGFLLDAGLTSLDTCHRRRDAGRFHGDCNDLGAAGKFSTYAVARSGSFTSQECPTDSPLRMNYADGDIAGTLESAFTEALEESGRQLQGSPDIAGRRPKVRCHRAIGAVRSSIVRQTISRSFSCQARLDRRASVFGQLDPDCQSGPTSAARRGRKQLARACRGIAGPEVGSCSSLPDCVIDQATATGRALADIAYGTGSIRCGNGIEEFGEDCDDGNTDESDDCTSECTRPRCGDGAVHAATEQCDDGNRFDDDGCRNDCTPPICGDGVIAVGVEECDIGDDPRHECGPDCKFATQFCGADGAQITFVLEYNAEALTALLGVRIDLGYDPALVTIPGSGGAVLDRVQNAIPDPAGSAALFLPNDHDVNNDGTDETLTIGYVLPAGSPYVIPSGDVVKVRFDCAVGTGLRPSNFACVVSQASDSSGTADTSKLSCRAAIEGSGTAPTTTTSTSTTVTTTTSTSSTSMSTTSTTTSSSTSTTESTLPGQTTSTSTSTTVTTSTSTTTTTILAVCGNLTVEGNETCDDGNTVDESDPQVPIIPTDNCPKTCAIGACGGGAQTAQVVPVNFTVPPGGPALFGITVFLDYPDAKAELLGSGAGVTASLTNVNPGALNSPNDLDYGLLDGMVSFSGLSGSKLFDVTLQRCAGLPALTAADFTCIVKDASDQSGNTVNGVTCSVGIP